VEEDLVTAYAKATKEEKKNIHKKLQERSKGTIAGAENKFKNDEWYWEVKFPVWHEPEFISRARRLGGIIMNAFPIMMVALVYIILKFNYRPYESGSTTEQTFSEIAKDLSFLFGVLLSLIFTSAVAKGKESKKLYAALCGDVKALAIWVSTLSDHKQVYNNPNKKPETIEVEYTKIRLLLSVVAPVAKHVIREHKKGKADYKLLDDKYRVIIRAKQFCGRPPPIRDNSQTWCNAKNPIKQYLYKKIEYIKDSSKMDLFEVIMYCLLDEIHILQEKGIGFGKKIGLERSLIGKWQDIYGSWGTMYSLSIYNQPLAVRISIYIALFGYTCIIAFAQDDNLWINFFTVIINILPYLIMWSIALWIEDPFAKSHFNTTIRKDARDTQQQVSLLMSNRVDIDVKDQLQFDIKQEAQEKYARNPITTIKVPLQVLDKVREGKVDDDVIRKYNSTRETQQAKPVLRRPKTKIYKTVNF